MPILRGEEGGLTKFDIFLMIRLFFVWPDGLPTCPPDDYNGLNGLVFITWVCFPSSLIIYCNNYIMEWALFGLSNIQTLHLF